MKISPVAGGYQQSTVMATGLAISVAADSAGNAYILDSHYQVSIKTAIASAYSLFGPTAVFESTDLAVDTSGALYLMGSLSGDRIILKIDYSTQFPLNFSYTPVGQTSGYSISPANVTNIGTAPFVFSVPRAGTNPATTNEFPLNSATTSCPVINSSAVSPGSVPPGGSCELAVYFAPQSAGNLTGTLVLSDNNLNVANATQTIALTGIGIQGTQTITFPVPTSPVQYGVGPITLVATASSGLAVTFTVTSGPATLSGNILTITGAGTVVVTATQAGNGSYAAATPVSSTIVVQGGSAQLLFFPPLANYTNGSTVPLIASSTSGLAVTFTVIGPATVNANGTLTVTGAGTVSVTAVQTGNSDFAAATSVSRFFTAQ
jgi:hypothetical protein